LPTVRSGSANKLAQHPALVIGAEPVDLVVNDADRVSVGEFGRKLERGHVHTGDVRWPTAGGLPGKRGFLPVPVESVDPFLGLGGWKDQFVAAEELHERGPVRPYLLPRLLDFPGIG
jgi:hypothetical protein